MKRLLKSMCTAIVAVMLLPAVLSACNTGDAVGECNNIDVSQSVCSKGEQEITVIATTEHVLTEEEKSTFRSTIKKEDIHLKGLLTGKTVDKLEYVSETEIKLTLSGECKEPASDTELGELVIQSSAMSNGKSSTCMVSVVKPGLNIIENSTSKTTTTVSAYSVFELLGGTFVDNPEEYVKYTGDGTLSCQYDKKLGTLTVSVKYQTKTDDDSTPSVVLESGISTLNTQYQLELGRSLN